MALTKKQRQIFDYLVSFVETNGYTPTLEVIRDHFGLRSLATVHEHIINLEKQGLIRRKKGRIEIVYTAPNAPGHDLELPLRGCVAAGLPIEVIPDAEQETIAFHEMVQPGDSYVLRVRGDSMIDEQIRDGDFVVVNERQGADNGEMVIALLNGNSATVKKFYRERDGRIRLQPANETMAPIYVHENDITIQGVVVGVLRRY